MNIPLQFEKRVLDLVRRELAAGRLDPQQFLTISFTALTFANDASRPDHEMTFPLLDDPSYTLQLTKFKDDAGNLGVNIVEVKPRCSLITTDQRVDELRVVTYASLRDKSGPGSKPKALDLTIAVDVDDPAWRLAERLGDKSLADGVLKVEFQGAELPVLHLALSGAGQLWVWAGSSSDLNSLHLMTRRQR